MPRHELPPVGLGLVACCRQLPVADATWLPRSGRPGGERRTALGHKADLCAHHVDRTVGAVEPVQVEEVVAALRDRKSTRLNSSHVEISYAVFCLKKKK